MYLFCILSNYCVSLCLCMYVILFICFEDIRILYREKKNSLSNSQGRGLLPPIVPDLSHLYPDGIIPRSSLLTGHLVETLSTTRFAYRLFVSKTHFLGCAAYIFKATCFSDIPNLMNTTFSESLH